MDYDKKQAVHEFISENFSSIPTAMVGILAQSDEDQVQDITPLEIGNEYTLDATGETVEVVRYDDSKDEYIVKTEDGEEQSVALYEIRENDYRGQNLPMWNQMWLCDRNDWYRHLGKFADAGFRVYDLKDFNMLAIGIDGAGYSFIEEHWMPLYDSLGYKWHELDAEMIHASKAVDLAASLGAKPAQIAKKLDLPKDIVNKYMPQHSR